MFFYRSEYFLRKINIETKDSPDKITGLSLCGLYRKNVSDH